MALIDEIKQKNPSLRDRSDDEIKSLLRQSPEFRYFNDDEFEAYVGGDAQREQTDETPGFLGGLSAGIDQVQAMGGGLLMTAGEAMESEGVLDLGRDIYQSNMEQAQENDLGYGFTDIRGPGDAWNWARYTAGNLLPMMGASIAGGGVGGAAAGLTARTLAGAVAKEGAKRAGQALGAFGASAGMETGAIMGETEDLDVSLAHGTLAGALDAVTPIRLLRSAGKGELADKAASEISEGVLTDLRRQAGRTARGAAGRGSLTNLVGEASTEGLQGLISQHANYWVENNGDSLLANLDEVDVKAMIDEAAAGGLMGGLMGAPAGLGERGQARRQVEQIEAAREQAAAQGGDALDQAQAAQEAEQASEPEQEPADPAASAEVGNRIQLAMGELDDLQNLARGSSYQGQTRLRNISTILDRAERAFEEGNVDQARRLTERADGIARNLRSALEREGSDERPARREGEVVEGDEGQSQQGTAGLLGMDGRRLPPGDPSIIYGEGPTADTTQYDPQARNVRRDEAMAAQRQGEQRMREQASQGRPQIADQGIVYGQGPVAGNANTGLDQPFGRAAFTDTGDATDTETARARQQQSADRAAQVARTRGRGETAYLPDNTPVRTRFRVMDAADLRPSNTPDGRVNPDYPQELQPRDRTNANSQVQVRNIAARLNPERLGSSRDAGTGAPIIGSDGVVESGNGRAMAIAQAYQQDGPQARAYRDAVRRQAEVQGIDPTAVDEMERPVLVRERVSNIERADFARRANESQVAGMTAYEQAQTDADSLTADDLQAWSPDQGGDPLAASNRDFQRAFVQRLGNNEAARYTTRDGQASPELGQRMQRAVFAKAYQDADMVEMATEQGDQMRNLTAALQVAAPDLAVARETGSQEAFDAIGTINDAVRIVRQARQDGISVRELTRQTDAFSDPVPETTALLAVAMHNNLRSRRALSEGMRYIGQAVRSRAENERNGALFEDTTTNEDVINAAFQEDSAQRTEQRPPEGAVQPGAERGQRQPTEGRQAEAAARAQDAEAVDDAPLLATYDEQELAEREQANQQAQEEEARIQREGEQRAAADSEADDFRLAGSDRPADVLAAGGQQDLMGAQPQQNVADAAPTENQQGADDLAAATAFGTRPLTAGETAFVTRMLEMDDVRQGPRGDILARAREAGLLTDDNRLDVRNLTAPQRRDLSRAVRNLPDEQARYAGLADEIRTALRNAEAEQRRSQMRAVDDDAEGSQNAGESPAESRTTQQRGRRSDDRIEDFGERIEGARKDQVNQVMAGLETEVTNTTTLSEAFPAPNYSKLIEEGVDPRAAAFVAVIRNSIPAKPRKSLRLKMWMRDVQQAQSLARDLLSGETTIDQMLERSDTDRFRKIEGALRTAELIAPLKPSLYSKAAKWRVDAGAGYSLYDGQKVDASQTVYVLRDERGRRTGVWSTDFEQMREKAANVITGAVQKDDSKPKSRQTPINVYRDTRTNERFIAFKAGSRVIRLQGGFESASAAADYITEHRDALQQQIDAMRAGPRMRNDSNAPREGMELRDGDVTPNDFQNAFGFRGVQFGNYVEGQRRQADLNRAYDALMDLATTMGVPPKAMSLDGTLGLAFGARGKGGRNAPAAHYEPGQVVINLTKTQGPGSLAHEWFHALDNFIPHGQGRRQYQTDLTTDGPARAELAERWREMRQALKDSGFEKRSKEFDAPRSKPYFGTPIEMAARAFERYTKGKLEDQGVRNDYLVNIDTDPEGPYPTDAEMEAIGPAFDRMMGTLEHRETPRGVELYSLNPDSEALKPAPRAEDIATALEGIEELGEARVIQSARELPPQALLGMALRGVNPRDVRGMYIEGELYVIADNVESVQEGVRTAVHEAVGHKGMRAVLGTDLERVMLSLYRNLPNSKAGREALREVRRDYPFLDPAKREDRITIGEEMVAHLLEKGHRPRAWQRAVAKIRELLRRLFPSIAWTYTDALSLGEKSRDYLRRQQDERGGDVESRFAMAGDTTSRNFKRWFGDSKVVDENGEPLAVYHGSTDRLNVIEPGYDEPGAWFTTSFQTAGQYAKGDNPTMHDAYLKAENPLVADFNDWEGDGPVELDGREFEDNVEIVEYAESNGYDSVHFPIGNFTEDAETWVVFDPSQVKSASENRGTYDPNNPDIRYSLRGKQRAAFESQFDDFTDADRAAAAKIGSRTPPQRVYDWYKEKADRAGLKIRQGMVDRVAALKEMDEQLYGESAMGENINRSSWVLARMSNAANGALHAMLHNGRIRLDPKERIIQMQDGDAKGLGEVLGRLGSAAEIERFMGWIAGNRADQLAKDGRENLFDMADIDAMKGWNRGQMADGRSREQVYQEVFTEFQQYRDDVLAVAEQSGIISKEQREMWAEEFYVPFYRLAEDNNGQVSGMMATSGLSRQQAYKRLKGGTQNLNDLLQNTMMNFHHLLDASLKNQAAVQAVENAKQLGMAEVVPESGRDTKKSTFVMEGGKKVFYEIDDPLVFQALTALAHPGMNSTAMKVMRGFKRVFTNLTTTTPQFMVANLIRDSLQAAATNDVSKNVFKNVMDGAGAYRDQRIRAQMLASGASFNFGHLYGNNPDELRAQLTRNMRDANLVDGPYAVPNVLRAGWTWWNDVNNATENVNRAAIYAQNREGGELRAAFEARDLIDFSAHGAWPAVRILIDIVPFLNARIQGLDKIYRSGVKPGASVVAEAFGYGKANVTDKQAAARFWTVTGALAAATVALYLHNQDDEEFQKLEDWQRDTYWFFRAGDQAFFIPKPFEVGAIATMAERITEQFTDDQATGKLFRQRMMHMMTDTFSFSPVPQAVQPALDIYANYDAFTQRPIEGMGMERLSPELRRRSNTSKAGEWISSALNNTVGAIGNPETNPLALSPVQVDHLIGGYLGQVGTWAASSGDVAWRVATGKEDAAQRWYEYQPVRRFYKNLGDEDRYTKYGTIFYEGLREAERANADVKELREMGRLADAAERAESNRDMLALRLPLSRAQRKLSRINKQIDIIRRSNLDGEIKRQRIDRLTATKNQIQRALGERVQEVRAD
ncbi:MAG: LPD38 domain-containing protein [Pseudomonadota bacterium]